MHYLLSLIVWTPIIAGIVVLFASKNDCLARYLALAGSIIAFVLSAVLFIKFDPSVSGLQFAENVAWIPSLHINYSMGVDGISMPFILLNNFITVLVILAGFKVITHKVALYNSMFLMMTGFISGSFTSVDAILFYVFFEAMLIPMYLIIGVWGSSNRVYACTRYLVLY
jgi:NADH-quinone oxidoreductase subunit M